MMEIARVRNQRQTLISEYQTELERTQYRTWRELIEDQAHGGKLHYSMPAVRGIAPPGSYRLPKDIINKLGEGDPQIGGFIVHKMFGIEDEPDDTTIVHSHVVRLIGNGDLAKGRKVLSKFCAMLCGQGAQPHDYLA